MGLVDLFIIAFFFTVTTLAAVIYTIKHLKPQQRGGNVEQVVRTKILVKEPIPQQDRGGKSAISAQLIASRTEIEKIRQEINSILREVEDEDEG